MTYSNLSNLIGKQATQITDINARLSQEANHRKDRLKSYQDQLSACSSRSRRSRR
ncbi:hypothetical protein [Neorhizobium sp. P12A]|uniref:hypothetical protein n=1 Tax=Neorhizobium sp. P12A TaxID=2268027 RepID=UPI00165D8531|nr:hypothetical protein [Neorhizobium sp. P12A]